MKENPKYNLVSARLDDELYAWVKAQKLPVTQVVENAIRRAYENRINNGRT
jgi:post-segregation antitoxin (ccd killing protein)